ncbi:MAG TPA: hypothetical protein PLT00_03855 [Verrucomicrobiota bacterium]|jgi:septin family protein|nr:MAG: hypothetical protein BWX84_02162 [Verrucomicrobia bacterium ADurb.Bin118]HPY30405.1 hypothetical protein [Verrucomicrobiota bacterium]HQB15830.1 hypothetical protein [Verrucomicrobiota bacterium]
MKTAYELAMERLSKSSPAVKLTAQQKRAIAEVDARYQAKLAEREITLRDARAQALAAGDGEKAAELEQQLAQERQKLRAELEEKKEAIRQGKG